MKCAYVYVDPARGGAGRCGNHALKGGGRFCGVHSPACKAKTKARHLARRGRDPGVQAVRADVAAARAALVVEIKSLAYFWDGPGTEGRFA